MRVLVIGVGSHIFSAAHAPALDAVGAEVVGVHDADAARASAVADARGWPVYGELAALLDVPADLAVVTAPHPAHAELACACLRAGLNVMLEKPVAVRIDDADAIVEEADRAGRTVAIAFQHRLRREVRAAKAFVDEGRLGELHRAEVVAYYPKRSVYYTSSPWRGTWAGEGGGVVLNQGQHDLDVLTYLAGRPSSLYGVATTRVQPIETEDTAEALVEWPGGATGSIHISSAAADGPPRLVLVGTDAVLRLEPGSLRVVENDLDLRDFAGEPGDPFDRPASRALRPVKGGGGTHTELYADLADALREGRQPVAPLEGSLDALELTNALAVSSATRAPVGLPLDRSLLALVPGLPPRRSKGVAVEV